jgi:hypothetical protein
MRSSINFCVVWNDWFEAHVFVFFCLAKLAKSKPLNQGQFGWLGWKSWTYVCDFLHLKIPTYNTFFLLDLSWNDPIHFLNSCACLEFWTFSQVENVGGWLSWEFKRPTCLHNSYAQSEFWTLSWVKRMSMIFLSFKMTYPLLP